MSADGRDPPPDERRTGYGEAEEGWEPTPREGPAKGASAEGMAAHAEEAAPPGRPTGPASGPGPRCELCGGPVEERHCKILCLNCGYQRDCSDP